MISAHKKKQASALMWLVATFVFGAVFIALELYEFNHLIHNGNGPQTSAFLSAFFTLVGLHGLHVTAGLFWLIVLMIEVIKTGLTGRALTRLGCLSLFWHFLDIIWICVFTVVYLMGAI
jgi:cytochrome o ubiquinol oxidase subunit 3